jgi:hypothetical protein
MGGDAGAGGRYDSGGGASSLVDASSCVSRMRFAKAFGERSDVAR